MVITIRARSAASAAEAATAAPPAASGSAFARVRLCTARGSPAARRLRAIGNPILPRPDHRHRLLHVALSFPARLRGRDQSSRRSEEHTSELQSLAYLVCRLLLEKKKTDMM